MRSREITGGFGTRERFRFADRGNPGRRCRLRWYYLHVHRSLFGYVELEVRGMRPTPVPDRPEPLRSPRALLFDALSAFGSMYCTFIHRYWVYICPARFDRFMPFSSRFYTLFVGTSSYTLLDRFKGWLPVRFLSPARAWLIGGVFVRTRLEYLRTYTFVCMDVCFCFIGLFLVVDIRRVEVDLVK